MLRKFNICKFVTICSIFLLPATPSKACDLSYKNGIFTVTGGAKINHAYLMTDDGDYALEWIAENC